MRQVIIGRVKLEGKRVIIADPLVLDRQWAHRLWNGQDQTDRTITVAGAYSALAAPQIPGGMLGLRDGTGGEAAVVRLEGEQAEVIATYDDNGKIKKVEIAVIN